VDLVFVPEFDLHEAGSWQSQLPYLETKFGWEIWEDCKGIMRGLNLSVVETVASSIDVVFEEVAAASPALAETA
jgi:hypothetical protein